MFSAGEDYYPTFTFPIELISDHQPVPLYLPGALPESGRSRSQSTCRLREENFLAEEWVAEDKFLGRFPGKRHREIGSTSRTENAARLLGRIGHNIKRAFGDSYTRAATQNVPRPLFDKFKGRRSQHPHFRRRQTLSNFKNKTCITRSMSPISGEKWKNASPESDLAAKRSTDTCAICLPAWSEQIGATPG